MTRLQIGSMKARNLMMESLLRLLNEDEKNMLIIVAQYVVSILTRLLYNKTQGKLPHNLFPSRTYYFFLFFLSVIFLACLQENGYQLIFFSAQASLKPVTLDNVYSILSK